MNNGNENAGQNTEEDQQQVDENPDEQEYDENQDGPSF